MRRLVILALLTAAATAAAASAAASSHVFTLRSEDVAVFRGIQCIANVEAGVPHFLCSSRPRGSAKYDVAIFRGSVAVYRMGRPDDPIFTTR